jgi:hypothetical protein
MHTPPFSTYFDIETEVSQSRLIDLSALQESALFRNLFRARALSSQLVDDKGALQIEVVDRLCASLEVQGFIFYPTVPDSFRDHALNALKSLREPALLRLLKRFRAPLCHKGAERLIWSTLGVPFKSAVTDALVRRAVLCAYLTPLRQSVGSCFATAPAILIQSEQPLLFFEDFYQLLSTGKLRRVVEGVEYALPLSPSTGLGDLRKPLRSEASPAISLALQVCEVTEIPKNGHGRTTESLIQAALLHKWGLTAQDLEGSAKQQLRARDAYRMGAGISLKKVQQIDAFKADEEKALETFKAYSENPLLKAWEFTLASFSEVKMEFSKWNFYTSLGFAPEEQGGIGAVILKEVQSKLDELNGVIQKYQRDYEIAFDEARAAEALFRSASSEMMARRLSAEYQSKAYHMRICLDLRDEAYATGSHVATLLSDLLNIYTRQFSEYFQEIYDATMQDVKIDFYEDSPAGFRLVYKQGRSDPSAWTLIYDQEQYIASLADFFALVQPVVIASFEWKEASEVVSNLTTKLILHVRTDEFLETALGRMARSYGLSLPPPGLLNLSLIDKKPWAYTSGGTMTTLLKTYYSRAQEFKTEERWVESAEELLIFILDTLKQLPPKVTDPYLRKEGKRMLMTSPTHAFSLLPGAIKEGWQGNEFTYTWVRDRLVAPAREFYANTALSPLEQQFLCAEFCKRHALSLEISFRQTLTVGEWRLLLSELLPSPQWIDLLDGFLVASLPLTPLSAWKETARSLFPEGFIPLREPTAPFLTGDAWLQLVPEGSCLKADLYRSLRERAIQAGLTPRTTLVFADTNWSTYFFAFVFNPGTDRLELWRTDAAGWRGVPMSSWAPWLNGESRKTWTLFIDPQEYAH